MNDPVARVKDKYLGSFADAVMTMISVVLGITLYFLTVSVQQICALNDLANPMHQFLLWKALFVFLLAVGLFHMYQYTTPILFAPPSYFLGLPVFAIGTSLAVMAASIVAGKDLHVLFCIALTSFYIFCVIAFGQTLIRARAAPVCADLIKADACRNLKFYLFLAALSGLYLYYRRDYDPAARDLDHAIDYFFLFANFIILSAAIAVTKCKLLVPLHAELMGKHE